MHCMHKHIQRFVGKLWLSENAEVFTAQMTHLSGKLSRHIKYIVCQRQQYEVLSYFPNEL